LRESNLVQKKTSASEISTFSDLISARWLRRSIGD
jgi:hypothetical protein